MIALNTLVHNHSFCVKVFNFNFSAIHILAFRNVKGCLYRYDDNPYLPDEKLRAMKARIPDE